MNNTEKPSGKMRRKHINSKVEEGEEQMVWFKISFVGLIVLLTFVASSGSSQAGGTPPPDKTVFGCSELGNLGHAEILVGYIESTPSWFRYCVTRALTDGGFTYAKIANHFWQADTRYGEPGQSTPFYQGEVVLLQDAGAVAYYGPGTAVVNGPGFFMRAKERGITTGKAVINPPADQIKGMPYLGNPRLPPPADFLLPTPLWFDIESASRKESCWEWQGQVLIFPECINLRQEIIRLYTPIKAPYAPIPRTPQSGKISPEEVLGWCYDGYCEPDRFVQKAPNRVSIVIPAQKGGGVYISLPPGTWAIFRDGYDDDGTPSIKTAFGPQTFWAYEGEIMTGN